MHVRLPSIVAYECETFSIGREARRLERPIRHVERRRLPVSIDDHDTPLRYRRRRRPWYIEKRAGGGCAVLGDARSYGPEAALDAFDDGNRGAGWLEAVHVESPD